MSTISLLQKALSGLADVRRVYKNSESTPSAAAARGGRGPTRQTTAPTERGTKCTPCAAQAYVAGLQKSTQKTVRQYQKAT